MHADSAHDQWWQISEVVFGVPFLIAIGLQFVVPLSLPVPDLGGFQEGPRDPGTLTKTPEVFLILIGVLLVVAGLALVILARREFARHGEHTDPRHPTHHIMTTGVFSFSRNPLYLGIVIFLAGIALAMNLPWALVMLVPSIVACHYVLIAPEERYLTAKFGEEYARYARSVARWVGRRG